MPNKSEPITMDAVYTAPGYLFRRMQQIAVAIFMEECRARDLTPVQYAALIANEPGPFCFGDVPTIADLCLVPQLANARRFGVDVSVFPRLLQAEAAAKNLKAFADAAPDRQPDAE